MLHQPATKFVASPPAALSSHDPDDIKKAKAWIATARRCGLVVTPSLSYPAGDRSAAKGGVMLTGQDESGRNEFSSANHRFAYHPASEVYRALPTALIFDVLCADYGVHPSDPDMCVKVNARTGAEREERERAAAERRLLALCKRADPILRECERLETVLSELTDAFMDVEKPHAPMAGGFPVEYFSMPYAELKAKMEEWRDTPEGQANLYFAGLLASGRFRQFLRDKKGYDKQMHALRAAHGLTAAEKASDTSTARVRAIILEITALPATTAASVAAKCRVMKLCRETGWDTYDEFEQLALSIFDDGARLGDLPAAARPPRSGPARDVQH